MNESYKRGLCRHERREGGRGTERRNGRAHVNADMDDDTSYIYIYTPHRGRWTGRGLSPGLLPPLSLLSFAPLVLLYSWLRNQATVQPSDPEGQQKIHCCVDTAVSF